MNGLFILFFLIIKSLRLRIYSSEYSFGCVIYSSKFYFHYFQNYVTNFSDLRIIMLLRFCFVSWKIKRGVKILSENLIYIIVNIVHTYTEYMTNVEGNTSSTGLAFFCFQFSTLSFFHLVCPETSLSCSWFLITKFLVWFSDL